MTRSQTTPAGSPANRDGRRHHKRRRVASVASDASDPAGNSLPEFPPNAKPLYEVHAADVSKMYEGTDVAGFEDDQRVLMRCVEVRGKSHGDHAGNMVSALATKAEELLSQTIAVHPEVAIDDKLEWEISVSQHPPSAHKGVTSISEVRAVLGGRLDRMKKGPASDVSVVLRIFFWDVQMGGGSSQQTGLTSPVAQLVQKTQEIRVLQSECSAKDREIEELREEIERMKEAGESGEDEGCWVPARDLDPAFFGGSSEL